MLITIVYIYLTNSMEHFENNKYLLENLSKCKYLVWINANAIILNYLIPIKTFINPDPNFDLYLYMDIHVKKECINSGVMIIKNTT